MAQNAGGYETNHLTIVLDIGSLRSTPMATRAVPANPCRLTPVSTPFSEQALEPIISFIRFCYLRLTRNKGPKLLFSLVFFMTCFERINEGRAKGIWGTGSRFRHRCFRFWCVVVIGIFILLPCGIHKGKEGAATERWTRNAIVM